MISAGICSNIASGIGSNTTGFSNFIDNSLGRYIPSAMDDNPHSFLSKTLGNGLTNSTGAAGN